MRLRKAIRNAIKVLCLFSEADQYAQLGIESLEQATENGFRDIRKFFAEADLNPLRVQKGYSRIVDKLTEHLSQANSQSSQSR